MPMASKGYNTDRRELCGLEKVVEILVHSSVNVISRRDIKIVLKRLEKVPQASSLRGSEKSQAGCLRYYI